MPALTGPFYSTFRLRHLNEDPLPDLSTWLPGMTLGYSELVGADDALDSKDEAGSYVRLSATFSTMNSHVTTFRPLFDPPIPSDAIGYLSYPAEAQADYAQLQYQFRFETAPFMGTLEHDSLGVSPLVLVLRSDGQFMGRFADNQRDTTEDHWDTIWWDETDASNHSGPVAWNGNSLFVNPVYFFDPAQYFCLAWQGMPAQTDNPDGVLKSDEALWLSHLVGRVTWYKYGVGWHKVGGHSGNPTGGPNFRILTPGVGWVEVIDGPA